MDLDDLLEDLWEDVMGDARKRVSQAGEQLRRKARVPAFRRRLREAALWGSGAWFATFGGMGVVSELAIDGGWGTLLAVVFGGVALPAVPTGVWAWRTRSRDRAAAREAEATRRAKRERDELPVDVVADWKRLRRAQVLVEDLTEQGYVDVDALGEQMAIVGDLRELLVADKRASDLGAEPSTALRRQVADVADLLVALAAEAVDHRTEQVGRSGAPATLRDARDRLTTLRVARREVDALDEDAARATELVERARAERAGLLTDVAPQQDHRDPQHGRTEPPYDRTEPQHGRGAPQHGRGGPQRDRDDEGGTPRATPG